MKKSDSVMVKCNLRELRQRVGLTQSQLAEMLGVKRQAVYDIENGKYFPNTLLALRIAKIMNVSVEDIFEEKQKIYRKVKMTVESPSDTRITLIKVRGKLVGYPMNEKNVINNEFPTIDAIYNGKVKPR